MTERWTPTSGGFNLMSDHRYRFGGGGIGQLFGIPIVPLPPEIAETFADLDRCPESTLLARMWWATLRKAERITDGRRRHGRVKHARDKLRHARKVANHA